MSMTISAAEPAACPQGGPPVDQLGNDPGLGAPEIRFQQGLPGFPAATRFRLEPLAPAAGLLQLVSAEDPRLRFIVLAYVEGQLPLLRADLDEACIELGMAPEDAAVLLMVTARDALETGRRQICVNLRAPIFLDTAQGAAVQHVLPYARYPVRHCLAA